MSRLREWPPAAATALALFGFPYALEVSIGAGGAWYVLLTADVLVLAAVAVFLWSPLVVLAAAIVSAIFSAIALLGSAAANTCGDSTTATAVEVAGGALLALAIGTWGVRRGPRVLWSIPAGWIVYAVWVAVWAHLIPGGAGACFE